MTLCLWLMLKHVLWVVFQVNHLALVSLALPSLLQLSQPSPLLWCFPPNEMFSGELQGRAVWASK